MTSNPSPSTQAEPNIGAIRQALDTLMEHHHERRAYSRARAKAAATCGEFKENPLSALIESGYMQGMGKRTEAAIAALESALAALQAGEAEPRAPRAFRIPEPGTPWWQTAKDCGAWTDRQDGDVGYVHFGSVEALRVYTMKVCRQAEAAVLASQPMSREGITQAVQGRLTDAQVERLYRNLPPSQQQDARSLAAFKRVVHLIENVHRIGIGSGEKEADHAA